MDLFDIAVAKKLSGGGGGGGGGDSDFSLVQVTIYNNAQNGFRLMLPVLYGGTQYMTSLDFEDIEDGVPVLVPLYKGQLKGVGAYSTDGYMFRLTGTGGVHSTWGGDGADITGDGTLTIADWA